MGRSVPAGLRGALLNSRAVQPAAPARLAVWFIAARPKTLVAAAAPVLIGAGLAAFHEGFRPLPALAALMGALLIQVATNLANDYYDFVRGADTAERVGPMRVAQAGLLAPAAVRRGMFAALATATLVGSYLVWVGGWPILLVGLVSMGCAVAYTGGPFPLVYHGLGDPFVFVLFGLVAVAGTVWVQMRLLLPDALLAGAGVGALSTAILVVNNLRDRASDARTGKRTLAVRLGRTGTAVEYSLLLGVGVCVPVVGITGYRWPAITVTAGLAATLLCASPLRAVWAHRGPTDLLPALGQTARAVALYGILLGASLAWGPGPIG